MIPIIELNAKIQTSEDELVVQYIVLGYNVILIVKNNHDRLLDSFEHLGFGSYNLSK